MILVWGYLFVKCEVAFLLTFQFYSKFDTHISFSHLTVINSTKTVSIQEPVGTGNYCHQNWKDCTSLDTFNNTLLLS